MTANARLRVALVGCGLIGQWRHIPALLGSKEVELVAISDENEELVRKVAEKFRIDSYHTDFYEMLKMEEVDMVDICTPPRTHLDFGLHAMEAGCHVLLEKPMALDVLTVDRMVDTSKRNHVKLCVVHNKLFEPVMMKARAMVNQGGIGDLVGIDVKEYVRREDPLLMNKDHWCHQLPGGFFAETLPHSVYIAQAFLGVMEPIAIHARKTSGYEWVIADEIRVIVEGRKGGGVIAHMYGSPKDKLVVEVYGTKKNLRIDVWNSVLIEYGIGTGSRFSRVLENLGQSSSILVESVAATLSVISGRFHNGHHILIRKFIESIRNDTEPPVTLEEAREAVRVVEAITARPWLYG